MNNQIKSEIDKIKVPSEIKNRTIAGIKMAKQELSDKGSKDSMRSPKRKIIVAVLLAIMVIAGIGGNYTTLAKIIGGYFQDITDWKGAVTGLEYHDATNEILIKADKINISSDSISVGIEVELLKEDIPPYSITQVLTVGEYSITTGSGKEINIDDITIKPKNQQVYTFEISDKDKLLSRKHDVGANGKTFEGDFIFDNKLLESENSLIINIKSLYSQAKAEAPLEITGDWKVEASLAK